MSQPARVLRAAPGDGPDNGWDPPLPLASSPRLPVFPVDALPMWMSDQVAAVAEATQTPPDLAGCIGLAALSTAAGGRAMARIRPGWSEPVNIYTVVVMEPSERKSPVFTAMVRPIYELEAALRAEAKERIEEARVHQRAADSVRAQAEKKAEAVKGEDRDEAIAAAVDAAIQAAALTVPVEPKLVVDDITTERVAGVLSDQGGRLAVLSDEGSVFGNIAGRYSSGQANTAVFLKGYTGTQLRVDRQGRPAELVEAPALTLGLTVQPAVIAELGQTAMLRGSGFLARILYSLPTSMVGRRKTRPPAVPAAVSELYNTRLHTIAHNLHERTDPAEFTFTEQADDLMAELQEDTEQRLAPGGEWRHVGDWGGKLCGQTARIAGLLHAAEHPHNPWEHPLSGETFTDAWRIGDYYAHHALAVFDQLGGDPTVDGARRILDWIQRVRPARFTRRDLFTAIDRHRFRKATDLDAPLALLEEHGHLHRQETPTEAGRRGRKPSPTYWTHPTYRAQHAEGDPR